MKDQQTEQKTGTTLAILQSYPLGTLEVEVVKDYIVTAFAGLRGILTGLECNGPDDSGLARIWITPELTPAWTAMIAATGLLPVLRSFDQLCDPLPDGTVPYEVIHQIWGNNKTHSRLYKGARVEGMAVIETWESSTGADYDRSGALTGHLWGNQVEARVANYLRSVHFAVGLNESQYIRKG